MHTVLLRHVYVSDKTTPVKRSYLPLFFVTMFIPIY